MLFLLKLILLLDIEKQDSVPATTPTALVPRVN
jgi:hypothetical protein